MSSLGKQKLTQCPQIYYDALGKDGALAFMIVLCIVQYLIGLSLVSSTIRI